MIGYLENLGLSIKIGNLEEYKVRKLFLISKILESINKSEVASNFVLKGGTALLLCHGLDRFSEDIDLDGIRNINILKLIVEGCRSAGIKCNVTIKKSTDTVLRYMVDFQDSHEIDRYPLKIEISFRNKDMLAKNIYIPTEINGIRVYSLRVLMAMKLSAFRNRHAIRDFYDVCWFVNCHPNIIGADRAIDLWEQLQYKGINLLIEELSEVSFEDHIMREMDIESLALRMLDTLPKLMNGDSITTMSVFSKNE